MLILIFTIILSPYLVINNIAIKKPAQLAGFFVKYIIIFNNYIFF